MGKYTHAERERIALETFIEAHAPGEATEGVWRLLARRIVDLAKAEMREEIEGRLDAEAARVALEDVEANGTVPWDEIRRDLGLRTDRTVT